MEVTARVMAEECVFDSGPIESHFTSLAIRWQQAMQELITTTTTTSSSVTELTSDERQVITQWLLPREYFLASANQTEQHLVWQLGRWVKERTDLMVQTFRRKRLSNEDPLVVTSQLERLLADICDQIDVKAKRDETSTQRSAATLIFNPKKRVFQDIASATLITGGDENPTNSAHQSVSLGGGFAPLIVADNSVNTHIIEHSSAADKFLQREFAQLTAHYRARVNNYDNASIHNVLALLENSRIQLQSTLTTIEQLLRR